MSFDTYHRNDQPEAVRTATGNVAPVVVAETEAGLVALLRRAELDAREGSIERLTDAIEHAAVRLDLAWPDA